MPMNCKIHLVLGCKGLEVRIAGTTLMIVRACKLGFFYNKYFVPTLLELFQEVDSEDRSGRRTGSSC